MKASNLRNGTWNGPTLDSFNLGLINLDSLFGENIIKEDKN